MNNFRSFFGLIIWVLYINMINSLQSPQYYKGEGPSNGAHHKTNLRNYILLPHSDRDGGYGSPPTTN
uniref:Uncharacterized protein n=1 Tax=Phakopsora pachyrhizi TaxID=170000 RepID=A0A0S1MJ52_PHAPC